LNRSFFFNWNLFKKYNNKNIILNFGPQHPAAHGVLRLILQLEGEIVQRMDIHIGLLHRGTELLIESKHYEKSIPYFDRMDYCSMMSQEHAFVLAIENLLNIKNTHFAINLIRIMFDELTRILNHMLAVACHALDIGSMSSIFWAFEEREKIMEFYERVSGARMHAAFHRPANIYSTEIDNLFLQDILFFVKNCFTTLNEMHNVLTYNKIWKQRIVNIGVITQELCENFNLTGVMSRSAGVKKDLRLSNTQVYSGYNNVSFKSYFGVNGDCFDRYLIRMLEMGESLHIVNSVIKSLHSSNKSLNTVTSDLWSFNMIKNKKFNTYNSMEDIINHFLSWHTGIYIERDITLSYIEAPKGEFGVTLVACDSTKPYKCKVKSPSYYNLQALPELSKGHYLADIAALIGTIDIVFGEVDR
jgi:NADH dehydrogenase (ubiquinone) Fe-S protein 2